MAGAGSVFVSALAHEWESMGVMSASERASESAERDHNKVIVT